MKKLKDENKVEMKKLKEDYKAEMDKLKQENAGLKASEDVKFMILRAEINQVNKEKAELANKFATFVAELKQPSKETKLKNLKEFFISASDGSKSFERTRMMQTLYENHSNSMQVS